MKKTYEIDMCNGPLLGKILRFAIPLILSGMLQLLFNAADVIVVGRYAGNNALAAVGSTAALINLLVNLFMGISIGTNVLVARYYGSRSERDIYETVHTTILMALTCGIVLTLLGVAVARPILTLMDTPAEVLPHSVLYMRIYFLGMPAFVTYNFGAAILRAVGDTRRPLYFLSAAGVINVLFNLMFVVVFQMGVAGVAIATVISQVLSAVLVLRCLMKSEGVYQVRLRELHIYKDKLIDMLKIGLPAGLQGALFNISNMTVQSSVNSFGPVAMAGNTAANNIDGFLTVSVNAIQQTALSFIGQNMGAKKYKRVDKVLLECLVTAVAVGLLLGTGSYLLGNQLLHIYSPDEEVVRYGLLRMSFICAPYAIAGIMDVLAGSLRGMGASLTPMLVALTGICLFRIVWVFTVFQANRSLATLYASYPISWTLTGSAHAVCYFIMRKKKFRE